jgi:hypothetical protein
VKSARTVGTHGQGKIRHPKAYRVSRIGQAVSPATELIVGFLAQHPEKVETQQDR